MAKLAFPPLYKALRDNNAVCSDATATWYVAGSSTPAAVYTTRALNVPHTTPVVADATGAFPEIWLADDVSYRVVIAGTGLTSQDIDYAYEAETTATSGLDARYVGLGGGGTFTTTGATNTYAVDTGGVGQGEYTQYESFIIIPNVTNDGAATLNRDGLGAAPLKMGSEALRGGELVKGMAQRVTYKGTSYQVGDRIANLHHRTTTGSANAHILTTGQDLESYSVGQVFDFIAGYTNTASATLKADSQGVVPFRIGGQVLVGGEIQAGASYTAVYNGTYMELSGRSGSVLLPTGDSIASQATQAAQEAGTSQSAYVSPARQHHHPSAAKCWAYINGAGTSLLVSYNITSITDTGTGDVTITIAVDFSSASWVAVVSLERSAPTFCQMPNTKAAGSVEITSFNAASAAVDPSFYNFAGYGDQ